MKRAIVFILLAAALCGCDRYPSKLPPAEQVQALVFEHMAAELFRVTSDHDDASLRLFLCYGEPRGDPSKAVQEYVARSFSTVRPCSAVDPRKTFGSVSERGTGRAGVELRMDPFTLAGDGPLIVRVSIFGPGDFAEGLEYRLQRIQGRWKILRRKETWIS